MKANVKNEILKILEIVRETFNEEISTPCYQTILGLESYIEGENEFFKKLKEKLESLLSKNQ
jgi:hypothetical protein